MNPAMHLKQLRLKANAVRQDLIIALAHAGSGHSAGSLGMADVVTAIYFDFARVYPKNPKSQNRDYVVLSNGHICPLLYTVLAHKGFFSKEKLVTLRRLGSPLQGHPHRGALPGIETTSGPLGSGLSQAAGMALALKMDRKKNRVICLTSDGEQEEGNTWEAALFAAKYNLDNLIQVMDRNRIQIDGETEHVMPLTSLRKKYEAFNWHVIEVDGHDLQQVINALHAAGKTKGRPVLIIARTVPGKGVGFMENDYHWHGKPPSKEDAKKALDELKHARRLIR